MHPIFNTIENGDFNNFVELLEKNPHYLSEKDEDGWNLLPLVVHYDLPSFTQHLLTKLNAEDISLSEPYHPLYVAMENRQLDQLSILLKNEKISTDIAFRGQDTPFHYALYVKDDELIKILQERNSNPFIENSRKNIAFSSIIEQNREEVFNYYYNQNDLGLQFEKYPYLIIDTLKSNNLVMFEKLFPYYKGNIDTLLDLAISNSNVQIVNYLIDNGEVIPGKEQIIKIIELSCIKYSDQDKQDSALNLLDFLVKIKVSFNEMINLKGQNAWMLALNNNNIQAFEVLLNSKMEDMNITDERNSSVLAYAIEQHNPIFVENILKRKVNINYADVYKNTPLIKAVIYGKREIVQEILKYRPLLNEINDKGDSALNIAIRGKRMDLVEDLIWKGAEISTNPTNLIEKNELFGFGVANHWEKLLDYDSLNQINNFSALVKLGFPINKTNEKGDNLLQHFIKNGFLSNFYALINNINAINLNDNDNNSLIMLAAMKPGDEYFLTFINKYQSIDFGVINNQGKNVYDLCIDSSNSTKLIALISSDTKLSQENALKSLFFLAENGILSKNWTKLSQVIPNIQKQIDPEGNSLLMLSAKGKNYDNFQLLFSLTEPNLDSHYTNNQEQTLIDVLDKYINEPELEKFTQLLSHYFTKNLIKKDNLIINDNPIKKFKA